MMEVLINCKRRPPSMAISIFGQSISRMEAGIRKDRKGPYKPSAFHARNLLGRCLMEKDSSTKKTKFEVTATTFSDVLKYTDRFKPIYIAEMDHAIPDAIAPLERCICAFKDQDATVEMLTLFHLVRVAKRRLEAIAAGIKEHLGDVTLFEERMDEEYFESGKIMWASMDISEVYNPDFFDGKLVYDLQRVNRRSPNQTVKEG